MVSQCSTRLVGFGSLAWNLIGQIFTPERNRGASRCRPIPSSANDIGWRRLPVEGPAGRVRCSFYLAKMWGTGCLRRLGHASLLASADLQLFRVPGCCWLQPGALAEAVGNRPAGSRCQSDFGRRAATIFKLFRPTHFRARHGQAQDISAIVQRIRGTQGSIQGAIYLGSGSTDDRAAGTASYHALVALAEGLEVSPNGPTVRIIVATFGAESVLNEPVRNPAAALALGPVLALPTEVPQSADEGCRSRSAGRRKIGWRPPRRHLSRRPPMRTTKIWSLGVSGCRWMRRFERLSLPPVNSAELPLKPRGVYLITGGLGGIGLTLAHWFAANTSARLMLTARSPLPPREDWDKWLAEHAADDQTATIIQKHQRYRGDRKRGSHGRGRRCGFKPDEACDRPGPRALGRY